MSTAADAGKASNHYQLLRLKPFESDVALIRNNFHKLIEQVRAKEAAEPGVVKWKKMEVEMTRAMLVLCDTRRKADYDLTLGNTNARDSRPAELGKILRARKLLDDVQLDKARKFADTVNMELRDAVVQQKLLAPDVVIPLYADSLGLPFVHLADMTIDETLIGVVPAIMARQHSIVPVMHDGIMILVASPNPIRSEIEEQLRLRFDSPISQVICTKAAVDTVIAKYYPREAAAAQMSTAAAVSRQATSGKSEGGGDTESPRLNRAELQKKKLKIGFVCGAFTMMVVVFALMLFTEMGISGQSTMMYLMGFGAGLVAFVVGYLVVSE